VTTPIHQTAAASDVLAEVIRRVVEVARPDRIILFGSAALGKAGPDSDVDLLEALRVAESVVEWAEELIRGA
jgi:predicted nucleotidyltransferase